MLAKRPVPASLRAGAKNTQYVITTYSPKAQKIEGGDQKVEVKVKSASSQSSASDSDYNPVNMSDPDEVEFRQ